MTKSIYKFSVPNVPGTYEVDLELGYQILSCAEQNGKLTLWYLCEPGNLKGKEGSIKSTAIVKVLFTGQEINTGGVPMLPFIGTVQIGQLVYHVFAS